AEGGGGFGEAAVVVVEEGFDGAPFGGDDEVGGAVGVEVGPGGGGDQAEVVEGGLGLLDETAGAAGVEEGARSFGPFAGDAAATDEEQGAVIEGRGGEGVGADAVGERRGGGEGAGAVAEVEAVVEE